MLRREKRAVALTIASIALVAGPVPCAAVVRPYSERVTEAVLANGLKVILLEDHKAPAAVFQVWYRVGGRNESPGRSGLSHLLEHMMFKGTKAVGPEEYARIVQGSGGQTNAFTTEDSTTYYVTIASDRIGVVIDLEADRMRNLELREDLYVAERAVVMEERRLRTDNNPVAALFEQLDATAYVAHPYQLPIIGWMSDIERSTVRDLARHYRTYYVPNNAFIVAVGDFDSAELLADVRAAFEPIPPGAMPPSVRALEPVQRGERRVEVVREAELPFVALAHHVPNLHSRDAAALEILAEILSGGESARLHHELVYRRRLARQVGANFEYASADPGLFVVYGQPLPGTPAADLEAALLAEIDALRETPPVEREIQKAKHAVEAAFVFAQDSLFYQGLLLGRYEVARDWREIDRYLEAVGEVKAEDLARVSRFYLERENRTVATLVARPGGRADVPEPGRAGGDEP
jgi:zinc protease